MAEISEARLNANRQNARRSTGPKTDEGKAKSRLNALKHGLAGAGTVLPQDLTAQVEERELQWNSALRPWDAFEMWLVQRISLTSVRLEQIAREEAVHRSLKAARALVGWDLDRAAEAEALGRRLAKDPAAVVGDLKRSVHGCDWLIGRWEGLARVLDHPAGWEEEQRALALDLLGVPPALRRGDARVAEGTPADEIRELIRDEIEGLEALKSGGLEALDEVEREAAESGIEAEPGPPVRLLRRYESACRRELQWALSQLRNARPDRHTRPIPPRREPAAAPAPSEPIPAEPAASSFTPMGTYGLASALPAVSHVSRNRHARRAERSRRARGA